MPAMTRSRPPHWYGVPLRVLIVTFLSTLICFAVSLLAGIFGTVIVAVAHGVHPDMRIAYRHIALPIALTAGGIIFVAMSFTEVRRYRQMKALAAIERTS